jgi:transposase
MLTRWGALTRFLHDGRICLANNAAERGLRGLATGLSLCTSFLSIWKHWKWLCGFIETRASLSDDRCADGLRIQIV